MVLVVPVVLCKDKGEREMKVNQFQMHPVVHLLVLP